MVIAQKLLATFFVAVFIAIQVEATCYNILCSNFVNLTIYINDNSLRKEENKNSSY